MTGEYVYLIEADDPLEEGKVQRFSEIFETEEEAALTLEMALPRAAEIFQSVLGDEVPDIIKSVRVGKYILARCEE